MLIKKKIKKEPQQKTVKPQTLTKKKNNTITTTSKISRWTVVNKIYKRNSYIC